MEPLKSKLGNLAQKARKKTLDSARNWLIFVGVLQFIGAAALFFLARNNPLVDQDELSLITAVAVGIGLVYFLLAIFTAKFPLGCTVLALIIFITLQAMAALADPRSLVQG